MVELGEIGSSRIKLTVRWVAFQVLRQIVAVPMAAKAISSQASRVA
jgi:hypothetical protein